MRKLSHFTQKEIAALFSSAKTFYKSPELTILGIPRMHEHARLLIVTPRAIGNAPTRNKIRRRLRSIFYEHKLFNTAHDYAIMVKKEALQLPFNQLEKILVQAIGQ